MKKLKTLILFLCVWCALPAQPPAGTIFEQGTLDAALAKAAGNRRGPRLVFLDCYTTWCGPCKNMTEKIFPQEKGEGTELAGKLCEMANIFHPYSLSSFPAILPYYYRSTAASSKKMAEDYSKRAGIYKSGN